MQYYGSIEYTMVQYLRSVILSPPSQSLLEFPLMKAIECTINWTALLEDLRYQLVSSTNRYDLPSFCKMLFPSVPFAGE